MMCTSVSYVRSLHVQAVHYQTMENTVNIINQLRRKAGPPRRTGKIINVSEHKMWGNHIEVTKWETGEIWGHLPFTLQVGDELRFSMKSGRIGVCIVKSVQWMQDPPDMFFGTFYPVGYLDE